MNEKSPFNERLELKSLSAKAQRKFGKLVTKKLDFQNFALANLKDKKLGKPDRLRLRWLGGILFTEFLCTTSRFSQVAKMRVGNLGAIHRPTTGPLERGRPGASIGARVFEIQIIDTCSAIG